MFNCAYRCFLKEGYPCSSSIYRWFSLINHPAIGDPLKYRKPPHGYPNDIPSKKRAPFTPTTGSPAAPCRCIPWFFDFFDSWNQLFGAAKRWDREMPKFSTSSKTWKHLVITGLSSRKIRHYMETMLRSHPNMGVFNLYNTCFFFSYSSRSTISDFSCERYEVCDTNWSCRRWFTQSHRWLSRKQSSSSGRGVNGSTRFDQQWFAQQTYYQDRDISGISMVFMMGHNEIQTTLYIYITII